MRSTDLDASASVTESTTRFLHFYMSTKNRVTKQWSSINLSFRNNLESACVFLPRERYHGLHWSKSREFMHMLSTLDHPNDGWFLPDLRRLVIVSHTPWFDCRFLRWSGDVPGLGDKFFQMQNLELYISPGVCGCDRHWAEGGQDGIRKVIHNSFAALKRIETPQPALSIWSSSWRTWKGCAKDSLLALGEGEIGS